MRSSPGNEKPTPAWPHLVGQRGEVPRIHAGDRQRVPGKRAGDEERPGLDAVGDDGMCCAVQSGLALNTDRRGPGSFNRGAHFAEQGGKVGDLRFAGGILNDGFTPCEGGGHHEVLGAGDGDAVKVDDGALESVGRVSADVAVLLADLSAELLEPGQVQVDRPRSDGAASRQRDARLAAAGNQRSENEAGRAHGP